MRTARIIVLFVRAMCECMRACTRTSRIKLLLLPGGTLPERKTEGAAGYDVRIRALVHAALMDPHDPRLRATIFDFENMPADEEVARHVQEVPRKDGHGSEFGYALYSGECVVAGIGFIVEMDPPLFYKIVHRSGLAIRHGIVVTEDTVVDADYRGEAGAPIRNGGTEPFVLRRGMRIAQIIFQRAIMPTIDIVPDATCISSTRRGSGGFGSTGLF